MPVLHIRNDDKPVHDAHIVVTALAHRVPPIVSLNPDDFAAFGSEVAIVTPNEALTVRPSAAPPTRASRRRPRRRRDQA